MFSFLKKKESPVANNHLYAVAKGTLIPITEVNDPVFSQKMMGDGFAVLPENGTIFSPIEGEIISVFQTKHAVGMKTASGIEVLLHMGVDTVELNGAPFSIHVHEGDKVTKDTQIASVDLEAIKAAGKATDMIVVITNMDKVKAVELTKTGLVSPVEEVGHVEL